MTDVLGRIDAAISGLCPCGAGPAPGSAYCSYDCTPTHVAGDTDPSGPGEYGAQSTPMRWRPDLVSEHDDSDLLDLGSTTFYDGRHNARLYQRGIQPQGHPTVWHLRLDDGHRYVGCDLDEVDDIGSEEHRARVADAWQRLERELGNSRHLDPDADPWADVAERWHRPTVREQEVVCNWLRANNINPHDVPTWANIHVTRDSIILPVMARDLDGGIRIDPADPWRILTEDKTFPLVSRPVSRELLTCSFVHVDGGDALIDDFREWSRHATTRRGRVFIAPVGVDLSSPSGWTELGELTDDGISATTSWDNPDSNPLADIHSWMQRSITASFPMSPEAIRVMREQLRRAGEQVRSAIGGIVAPNHPEPEHPMLAAIEARRNRNTGPGQRPRAPRQINSRRGR